MLPVIFIYLLGCVMVALFFLYSNRDDYSLTGEDIKMRDIVINTIENKEQVARVNITDRKDKYNYTMQIEVVLNNGLSIYIQCDKNTMLIHCVSYIFSPSILREHLNNIIAKQAVLELKKSII